MAGLCQRRRSRRHNGDHDPLHAHGSHGRNRIHREGSGQLRGQRRGERMECDKDFHHASVVLCSHQPYRLQCHAEYRHPGVDGERRGHRMGDLCEWRRGQPHHRDHEPLHAYGSHAEHDSHGEGARQLWRKLRRERLDRIADIHHHFRLCGAIHGQLVRVRLQWWRSLEQQVCQLFHVESLRGSRSHG